MSAIEHDAAGRDLPARLVTAALAPGATQVREGVRLICIDGLAGAGKTTLAARVAAEVEARGRSVAVVHMDDLYEGWGGLLAAHGIVGDVVESLRRGEVAAYRRWDWERGQRAERVEVPGRDVVVVEGCGSAPPSVGGVAALVVWITAPDELRLARGLDRDGEAFRAFWLAFMADERALLARDRTEERADVVLDATGGVLREGRGSAASGSRSVGR